jgi:predicted TIM-barrel enzyme
LFTREEVIKRLRKTISSGTPIIGAGCSAGIIAKCAEIGGADLIIVYSTGKSRLMGLPTVTIGDSNALTLKMGKEIINVVKNTPVIAGIEGSDPTRRMDKLLKKVIEIGFSGVINFPTLALYDRNEYYRRSREDVGISFNKEVEMMKLAREMGLFTMAYVRYPDDARQMVKAGVDVICVHAGRTAGGLVGAKKTVTLQEACNHIQNIARIAKSINPEIIVLCHGGPISKPEDTQYIYEHSCAMGFVGASSIERIPIERAIIETVKAFKNQIIRRSDI